MVIAADVALHHGVVCEDLVQVRKDPRGLGTMDFENAVFGHGNPITENAATQFQTQFC